MPITTKSRLWVEVHLWHEWCISLFLMTVTASLPMKAGTVWNWLNLFFLQPPLTSWFQLRNQLLPRGQAACSQFASGIWTPLLGQIYGEILTGQFPIKSSSRFIVVHLCFIFQGCKNVPPDVLLPNMSLVMFRGFISSGTIYTSEYLPARCWGLERICVVGKSGDFTYKDSAVWIDAWCVFGVFQFQGRKPFITWGFRRRRAWHGLIPLAAAWREPKHDGHNLPVDPLLPSM